MFYREALAIGRKIVSFDNRIQRKFAELMIIFLLIAFPGILNWQHRIWLCLNEFNKARTDDSINAPENDSDWESEDLKLCELRNSCVQRAERFYSNAHFSSAIKECQELTDELRVRCTNCLINSQLDNNYFDFRRNSPST